MAPTTKCPRRSAVSLRRAATLSLVVLAVTLPAVHGNGVSDQTGDTGYTTAPHAHSSLNPTASIAHAVQRTRTPWLSAAKDRVINSVSSFLSHALPDPRYFSYDLDQFDDDHHFSPNEDVPLDSGGILDGPGLNWGGSTLEVVRSQAIFLTRSAAFGPRVTDDQGLKGFLLPISDFYKVPAQATGLTSDPSANPIHACPYRDGPGTRRDVHLSKYEDNDDRRLYSAFASDPSAQSTFVWTHAPIVKSPAKPPRNWIALVERGGGCGFADKVRVAQALGAVAVVVGDAPSPSWHGGRSGDPNEEGDPGLSGKRLITMFAPGDTNDVHIPSTFVTRPSYLDLERLIQETEKDERDWRKQHPEGHDGEGVPVSRGLEIVISKDDSVWEWPLIDFGILLLLLPSFMTVITIIVHRIRMVRQRRKERAPQLVVLGLPCLIWRGNGQPWEKIEGPDVDPGPGNGGRADASPSRPFASDDLESGRTGETIPLLAEDENEAGPSQHSQTSVKTPLSIENAISPTRPVNPASFLPPGRTYFSTDECAICLSDFVDGDRVRILPCGHIFHRQEVDDWLVRVKKLCPICKRDITVPVPPAPPIGVSSSSSSPVAVEPAGTANGGVAEAVNLIGSDAAPTSEAAETAIAQQEHPGDVSQDLVQHLFQDRSDVHSGRFDGREV